MAKTICWFQYTQKKSRKNGDKDGKELYKLMNNAVYGKTMENLRNGIDAKLVSKPSYISQKLFENDLVTIHKNKATLNLNKTAYIWMCILEYMNECMNSIMITLKINMVTTQNSYSQTQIV